METIKDPQNYGRLAGKYQLLEMARLNNCLKKHGIADKSVRYQICSDYFFAHGLLLDSDGYPFTWEGKELHPILCFAERYPYNDEKPHQLRKIYLDYHANLYWQTGATLRLLFDKLNEDPNELLEELGQIL